MLLANKLNLCWNIKSPPEEEIDMWGLDKSADAVRVKIHVQVLKKTVFYAVC